MEKIGMLEEISISKEHKRFYNEAKKLFKDRIYINYLMRFALGTDASCYRYIPQIVIRAFNEYEIINIFNLSSKFNLALTFRAYGSSLSGQALSDSILVITTLNWKNITLKEDSIRLACGVIGSDANERLKPFGKKIGPDPATISMASIGGIISNNSSGMCCGVEQNSYQTIKSIRIILYDGTILDTGDKSSIKSFLKTHKDLVESLLELREEILNDKNLSNLIKRKYKIKNTTGYSINSLVDFDNIVDILNHIFIGSEGTLGFISSVELFSLDDCKFKSCGLLFYKNISDAANAVKILSKNNKIISSAEIMDYYSLKSVQNIKGTPDIIKEIKEGNTCILLQTESNDKEILERNLKIIKDSIKETNTIFPPLFSQDENIFNQWWKIRKGLLPIASSTREDETSVITEDICFEIDKLGIGIEFIQSLFKKYDFTKNGIIFGHALSGNMHFIITPNLNDKKQKKNFENLVYDMAQGVSSLGGSIKAEHGTGRMVAPFVEMEWGKKAYSINRKIKKIFDPRGLLNPDVIITDDKLIHTKNIKKMPKIDDFIDKCMECGFCEKACPSNNLTLTPRQRITVVREMQRLLDLNTKDSIKIFNQMKKEYKYLGDETCAACSMCSMLCPLEIDTAKIALNLRMKEQKAKILASNILNNMDFYIKTTSFSLKMANIFNTQILKKLSIFTRNINSYFPYIPVNLPQGNNFTKNKLQNNKNTTSLDSVIYFTTCINRAFIPSKKIAQNGNKKSLNEIFMSLCKKSNTNIIFPPDIEKLCCGKAFINYKNLQEDNLNKLIPMLHEISQNGKIPIVLDHSACSMRLYKALENTGLLIYDLPIYIYEVLSKKLDFKSKNEDIAIYVMCALKKNNKEIILESLAKLCTNGKILKNDSIFCCGFAGNKGFFTPELNKHSLHGLEDFFNNKNIKRGFSSSFTCEIGLNDYSNIVWQHIAYLVDEVTVSKLS